MQTSTCRGQVGHRQQVRVHQRHNLLKCKAKTGGVGCFSALREELLSDFYKKKWTQSPWKQMVLWCAASVFLDLHHSDPSRTGEHQDFIEIPVRRGWGIGRGIENLFIPGFCSVSIRRLCKICNLAKKPHCDNGGSIKSPREPLVLTGVYGNMECFKVLFAALRNH